MICYLLMLLTFSAEASLPAAKPLLENWKDAIYTPFETSKLRMTIRPAKESPIVREADIFYSSDNRSDVKIFLRFNSPLKIRGTAFLSLKKSQSLASDQWIYFPAYKKARRLSSRKRNDQFLDSDFSNGDISFEYHQGHEFKVLKEATLDNKKVYVLEGKATKLEDALYARQVLYISQTDNLNLKSEFYDRDNRLIKEFIIKKWQKYGTHWAIDQALMKDLQTGSETELEFLARDISKRPAAKLFTLINLERGQ